MNKFAHLIVASGLLLITLAVNVSMPLFGAYAAASHLNNGQTSLVFASYVVGMLPCYIFLGGMSDRVGRKPVMIVSVCCALIATAIITAWPTVFALIFARFFQGVGVGLGMSAGTAYISELLWPDPGSATRAAGYASLFTAIGFGGGALTTSLLLLSHFTLTPASYYVLLVVTALGIVLLFTLKTLPPIGGGMIRLPYFPVGSLSVNIAIGICWAATGIVIAIIPTQLSKFGLAAYAGICLALVNWSGAIIQPFIKRIDPLRSVRIGLILVPIGFALVIWGCHIGMIALVFSGTAIVGLAAYGFSYLGVLRWLQTWVGSRRRVRYRDICSSGILDLVYRRCSWVISQTGLALSIHCCYLRARS